MRRFFTIFLIVVFVVSLAACGSDQSGKSNITDNESNSISAINGSSQEELTDDDIDLANDGFCIVVKLKSTNAVVNDTDDFSNYSVAYISDTDSEIYAKYYDFKNIGMYNAGNDLHSGLMGGAFDLGIVNSAGYEAYADDYDVVWDFSKEK